MEDATDNINVLSHFDKPLWEKINTMYQQAKNFTLNQLPSLIF